MREWRSGGVTGGFEERLRTLANQHAAIAEFGKIALVGIDPALLMVDAVETVAGALRVEYAGVFELLSDGSALRLSAGVGWEQPFGVLSAHTTQRRAFSGNDVYFLEAIAYRLVFVTGAMGEEMAIATLKSGATDYVLKNRLSNLVPAVQKAIRQAEQRARTTQMAAALKESEERFRMLVEGVKDYAIFMLDPESRQADKVLLLILLLILISPGRRGARLRARSRVRSSLLSIIQQQSLNPSRQTSPQVQDNHS